VIAKILSKLFTDAATRVLQQADVENTSPLHLRWEFLSRNVEWSVGVFFELLKRYFTDVKLVDPTLEDHEKEGLIVGVTPCTTTPLDALCAITANSIGDDIALVEIDALCIVSVSWGIVSAIDDVRTPFQDKYVGFGTVRLETPDTCIQDSLQTSVRGSV